jgi:FkbM family methyltransferase
MRTRRVNDRYELIVPDAIADWDAPSDWEKTRFASMEANLEPGMVLFDIGTEHGWIAAIYAMFVGPENMVLVEPEPTMWPNIRRTWDANRYAHPKGCLQALLGTRGSPIIHAKGAGPQLHNIGWPDCAEGPESGAHPYRYLHEPSDVENTPISTIDQLAQWAYPAALTIDVEGAEVAVLAGGLQTLRRHRPLVWVSVHPDLMARDYDTTPAELDALMLDAGYYGDHLGTDHEEHHLYRPVPL